MSLLHSFSTALKILVDVYHMGSLRPSSYCETVGELPVFGARQVSIADMWGTKTCRRVLVSRVDRYGKIR